MITDLAIDVNNFTFVTSDGMYIDIRPEDNLQPIRRTADEQPALVYLAGLGRSSQRTMYGALVLIAGILSRGQCSPLTLPWHSLRRSHVIAVRAWLIEHKSPATGRRMIAALKGTLKEAWRMGQLATDDYARAIDIKAIRGKTQEQAAGRALSHGEKSAILTVLASNRPVDIRNSAIFGLAVYGGLRRGEIAALPVNAYDPATGAIRVIGKGSKMRTIYAAPGVDSALQDWLHCRGNSEGPLFTRVLKSGRILIEDDLSPEAIYAIMQTLQTRAGVKTFTPHDLRRTFAGDLLDEGADIATVQRLMGHSTADTTSQYDRRGERAKQKAISKLHMPYQRKFQEE